MDKPELFLERTSTGKPETNHCFGYSPCCGKCGKAARVRSVKDSFIAAVKYVVIVFQCDGCRLKWLMTPYRTTKNVQNLRSASAAQKPN